MPPQKINNIVILGSGNLATHLALKFVKSGFNIQQIYSRNLKNAKALAEMINSPFTNDITAIFNDADLYIIAISDGAIAQVASELSVGKNMVVHTSGSIAMDVLNKFDNHGVFYPLQTFSKNNALDFKEVPLLIEANNINNTNILMLLAKKLSSKIYLINSFQRKQVHMAAVFACNFSNYMYNIAEKILTEANIPFEIIKPLIMETARKISNDLPDNVQTGPAVRNDLSIVEKHMLMLNNMPDYKKIYKLLTENIRNEQKIIKKKNKYD